GAGVASRVRVRAGGWAWRPGGVFHLDSLRSAGALGGYREREACGPAPTGPAPGAPNPRWSPIVTNGAGVRVHGRSCETLGFFIEPHGPGVRAPALGDEQRPPQSAATPRTRTRTRGSSGPSTSSNIRSGGGSRSSGGGSRSSGGD